MSNQYTDFFSESEHIIYHGSNCAVTAPKILVQGYTKDFGYAFYCTDYFAQARKWASARRGSSVVSVYICHPNPTLRAIHFQDMTEEWLNFIVNCRRDYPHTYDIVEGPMADDQIWDYVDDFVAGAITRRAFWELVKFKHPTHQIAFCTEAALQCISFKEAIHV